MAWIQVGTRKINTSVVKYVEQTGETLRLYFNSGDELELTGQEAAGFWRTLKSDNAMTAKDAGSTTMLPKYSATTTPAKPASTSSAPGVSVSVHKPHSSHSSSHSHSSSSSSHSAGAHGVKKH